jgi:hypothetical protein
MWATFTIYAIPKFETQANPQGTVFTTISFLPLRMKGSYELECYIILGWKGLAMRITGLMGPFVSYKKRNARTSILCLRDNMDPEAYLY